MAQQNASPLKTFGRVLLTAAFVTVLLYLVQMDVSVETHLWLSVSAFVVVVAFTKTTSSHLRAFTMLLGAFISIRYIVWRYSESLPWESALDLPFALLLLFAECYGVLIYVLGMVVTLKTYERKVTPIDKSKPLPSIDVYIPTYDESPDVVKPTILAATQLDYAGVVNVYLLDDGGTHEKLFHGDTATAQQAKRRANTLQAFCADVGAKYLTRPNNEGAKAGNINHALRCTHGELLLILDADHVPTRDFLTNTVGLFQAKPKLGFVQTPHFFVTLNPIDRNLGIDNQVQPENEMFYNKILLGMDYWNGCFFCGSAAVIRREALLEVGGIDTKTITEDADTALNIHAKGWDSAYLNIAMVAGLSPDTFGAYVTQRARWAQGMIQIFLLNNPMLRSGLTLPQRLCYLNSTLYWFFPIFRSVFLLSPLLYLLFDLQIFVGSAWDFMVYVIPHLLISMALTQQIFGRTRQAFFSELYETALSIYLLLPTLAVLVQPKKPSFKVTPKGETTQQTTFSKLTPIMVTTLALLSAAQLWGLYRYFSFAEQQSQLILVLIFNSINLVLVVLCLGGMLERQQRRQAPRMATNERAIVRFGDHRFSAKLQDISMNGARLSLKPINSVAENQLGSIVDKKHIEAAPPQWPKRNDRIDVQYMVNSATSHAAKPHFTRVTVPMMVSSSNARAQGIQLCCQIDRPNNTSHATSAENTTLPMLTALYRKTYADSQPWRDSRLASEQMARSVVGSIHHLLTLAASHVTRLLRMFWHTRHVDSRKPMKGVIEK
ncbi:UDP-forming cellulose synthase catalytic subunit [Vibrio sp. SM6]|uniref:Cellulose synthase catalytic subunit [UDP-forming] n=1 Tax=Vibrio agarilyticus TaxID=2726741 RepID=A0A7X8YGT6_9VIBR|nr:UDP-forming cellulose synthase catalytic subunit [Vibrio agarilyticus]NLS12999.1 UDP-forming cellulose synthase catalytic subunit [Vibrio agarilyticus]